MIRRPPTNTGGHHHITLPEIVCGRDLCTWCGCGRAQHAPTYMCVCTTCTICWLMGCHGQLPSIHWEQTRRRLLQMVAVHVELSNIEYAWMHNTSSTHNYATCRFYTTHHSSTNHDQEAFHKHRRPPTHNIACNSLQEWPVYMWCGSGHAQHAPTHSCVMRVCMHNMRNWLGANLKGCMASWPAFIENTKGGGCREWLLYMMNSQL